MDQDKEDKLKPNFNFLSNDKDDEFNKAMKSIDNMYTDMFKEGPSEADLPKRKQ